MFCKNCGNEISDDAAFCSNCGCSCRDDVAGSMNPNQTRGITADGSNSVMDILNECKEIIRMFFSKKPTSVIEKYAEKKTYAGLFIVIISTIVISLVFCVNATQIMNSLLSMAKNGALSLIGSWGDIGSSVSDVGSSVEIKIPVMYGLFWKMFLAFMVVSVIETLVIYFILHVKKCRLESVLYIFNIIGIANIPVIVGELLCFILGFIFVPLIFIVVASAIIIKIIFIYEGLKEVSGLENGPVIELSIFIVIMCIVVMIIGSLLMTGTVSTVYEALKSKADSMTNDVSLFN